MITITAPTHARSLARRWLRPRILAVFSFRYDAHLVPDLLANIAPMVDGWISWDDRAAADTFTGDTHRRHILLQAAHDAGAQWVLAVDPDERFESGAAQKIGRLALVPGPVCWTFDLREMFTPDAYRIDGPWGNRRRGRLFRIFDRQFPITPGSAYASEPLHGQWAPDDYVTLHSRINLYHLKMIDPGRRIARSALYSALDPTRRYQSIGYDYLSDDAGTVLEQIPAERRYLPVHRDDNRLWMADPATVRPMGE